MRISKVTKNGSQQWQASWFVDGSHKRRFFDTKELAKSFVEKWEREKTHIGRQFSSIDDASRSDMVISWERAQRGGYSLTAACDHYEGRKQVTVRKLVPELLESYLLAKTAANLRASTIYLLGNSLGKLATEFSGTYVDQLTTADLQGWVTSRGGSPKTQKNIIEHLGGFFTFAIAQGSAQSNPAQGLLKPIIDHVVPKIFTLDQTQKLLKIVREQDPKLLPMVSLCLFGGLRTGESRLTPWDHVQMEAGHVLVEADRSKGRARRLVTMKENLKAWLSLGGELPAGRMAYRLEECRRAAGINDWPRNVMRHTFCSNYLALTGSAAQTALQAGHSETILFKHYRELVRKSDAEKFFAIMP